MVFAASCNAAIAGVADKCMGCHDPADSMSLAGEDVNELVDMIKNIRSGAVRHPPGLTDLSDEDIAAIAAELHSAG
jgi:cytochrome c553